MQINQFAPVGAVNGEQPRYECGRCKVNVPREEIISHVCQIPVSAQYEIRLSRGPCIHRGEELRREQCPGCREGVVLKVLKCSKHGECCIDKAVAGVRSCSDCPDHKLPEGYMVPTLKKREPLPPIINRTAGAMNGYGKAFHFVPGSIPEFVTVERYMHDVKALASKLPANTSRIVGVARSGLCAATMISMLLHRPLSIVRQSAADIVDGGNGWRLTGATNDRGPVVVVDDTCMTGNSLRHVMPMVHKSYPEAIPAAVYVNPNATEKPKIFTRHLPWPHVLEWNMFNSILTPAMAVDFDGILCRDCAPQDDDDGPRYAGFIASAEPLYYVRKASIPLIVTARLEKYRAATLDWLAGHGMSVSKLIMGPWANNRERAAADIGHWKGTHYKQFMAQRRQIQPPLFVESDAHQAQMIAQVSGGIVVCPAAGRCF
jgi:adenine/guanine phosphoribosyltransferase-like PRPP-binding protein